MSRRRLSGPAQRGQALVAVMVVMVILFALAGAVAIGASTLLTARNGTGATTDDFRLHSAVNDAVAQVAGSTQACAAAPPPAPPTPGPTPNPAPSSMSLALPSPDGRARLSAQCARIDGVAGDGVRRIQSAGTGCRTIDLRLPGPMRVAVVFDVHGSAKPAAGGWAYVDGSPLGGCPRSVPPGTPCASTFDAGWTQVALSCEIPGGRTAQLHLAGMPSSPSQVFAARQDPPGAASLGSVYLLQVQTPVAGSALEEVLLFVGGAGGATSLLYEAPLQP